MNKKLYLLICISIVTQTQAQHIDTFKRFVTIGFGMFNMFAENRIDKQGIDNTIFGKSKMYSLAVIVKKEVYTYKKLKLNGYLGIKTNLINVSEIDVIQDYTPIKEKISFMTFEMALNFGVSIDTRLIKIKKSELIIGAGLMSSGYFYNQTKAKNYVFKRQNPFIQDSVHIQSYNNALFEISPFYQLTFKHKLNKKALIAGLQVFFQGKRPNNINYDFYETNQPSSPKRYSGIIDGIVPIRIFAGISF